MAARPRIFEVPTAAASPSYAEVVVALGALAIGVVPFWFTGPPQGVREWIGASCEVTGALLLAGWRRHPLLVLLVGPLLIMVPVWLGPEPSDYLLLVLLGYAVVLAEHFSGLAAWLAGAGYVAYIGVLYVVTGDDSPGLIILTLPGFAAGTVLRLRRETAEELAERGRELAAEREVFAQLSVRNERARIASELHDIVGHALSVMVVQAAAGQRLADRSPSGAAQSLNVIAESARHGRADLHRLIDLLAGTEVASPDLSLVDDVVNQAARSGLCVTCRLEGERDGVGAAAAHVALRVVQESLTNALRHAPGAGVRVLIRGESGGRALMVRVENEPAPATGVQRPSLPGGGRGLIGLRERVLALGGTFTAGPASGGGWRVEAHLSEPAVPRHG